MKVLKIFGWVLFGILLLFLIVEYNSFRYYHSDKFHNLRTYLGYSLSQYSSVYYKKPDSIGAFIDYLKSQDKTVASSFHVDDINYLNKNKLYLKFKQIKDSNVNILYHTGFDHTDNHPESALLDYDTLSFLQYLLRPKGDILIAWANYVDICNSERLNFEFYKKGIYTADQNIKPIIDSVYNNVWNYANNELTFSDTTYLLFRFYYDQNKWKGKLLCNWSGLDSVNTAEIKNKFEYELDRSQMNIYADSLIHYFAIRKIR